MAAAIPFYVVSNIWNPYQFHVTNSFRSVRSKLPSKTAGTSRYQNLDIYTPEENSQEVLSNDHRWPLRTQLMRKLLAFLIFSVQISIERKLKAAGTRADQFGTIHKFLQRATTGTSFDVRWSLVA